MKIIDYYLIETCCSTQIDTSVTQLIKEGFQPFGGVCVTQDANGDRNHFQAMVKYEQFKLSPGKFAPIDEQESHSFLNEVIQENEQLVEKNKNLTGCCESFKNQAQLAFEENEQLKLRLKMYNNAPQYLERLIHDSEINQFLNAEVGRLKEQIARLKNEIEVQERVCREEELEKDELLSILVKVVSYHCLDGNGRTYFAYNENTLLSALEGSKNQECNEIIKQMREIYRENNNTN